MEEVMNKVLRLLCLILIVLMAINHKAILKSIFPLKYNNLVYKYSKQYNIDSMLVFAVIKAESNFNENAVSKKGAVGLMQITPKTGEYIADLMNDKTYKNEKLFEPEMNIKYGCFYLKRMINQYDGNIELALMAYNAGSTNVNRWIQMFGKDFDVDLIPFNETKNYVKKIKKYYKLYQYIYTDIDI